MSGLYKRLLKCPADSHITDEEVLFRTGLSSPTELLRVGRLRYLGLLFSIGEAACWGLLNGDTTWTELVRDDLARMWRQLHHCCSLGDPSQHLQRWLEIIAWHRGYWRRLVRRAAEHAIGIASRHFLVVSAHIRFIDQLFQGDLICVQDR